MPVKFLPDCQGLPLPILHLFVVFRRRNLIYRDGESRRSRGRFNLPAQAPGKGVKLRRGEVAHAPLLELGLDPAQLFAQRVDAVGHGGQPFFAQGLQLDGLQVLDRELVFTAPRNQGGLGDIELGQEARIAPALGAQFNEPLNSGIVVHIVLSGSGPDGPTIQSATRTARSQLQPPVKDRRHRVLSAGLCRADVNGFRCLAGAFTRA